MEYFKKINFRKLDYIVFLSMTILIFIGLYCVRQADILSEDKNGLYTKQLLGAIIGSGTILVMLFIDYRFISKLSFLMYIGITLILAFTLFFGNNVNNVNRWITIAGIPFQPSELAKVVLIIFLAYLCDHFKNKMGKFYVFFILAAITAVPTLLIVLEPHLSSGLSILFIFAVLVYSSGVSYKVIGTVLAVVLPIIIAIIVSVTVFNVKLPFIQSYQINRVLSFLSTDEEEDAAGKFQQNQAIAAIQSGGLSGKMLVEDDSNKNYRNIYANESDFIFSIVGEELGFVGSIIIILLYFAMIVRCFIIASQAPDYIGKIICIGVSSLLIFQVFVNIGVSTSLLPNTGLPLPFISYGVTSLVSSMIAVGLVLNISLRRND
ncbi:MAG: Rod shape-determining protein RodA [Herbinix sp.]|jgi:rod shape determining protein RodA|nr:Rod shape-determining protein RodA [Herbinix sp.]